MGEQTGCCPQCRERLCRAEVLHVRCHVGGLLEDVQTSEDGHVVSKQDYGSKVSAIIARLRHIRVSEPSAKVVVFVQWGDIMAHLAEAFEANGLETLVLKGTTRDRQLVLNRFKEGQGAADGILLLSLSDSVSGMNLICSHHCLLVHPMFAESNARALAYEKQAVGRVHRQGQEHPVHVYHFVTSNTIEEELASVRRGELASEG